MSYEAKFGDVNKRVGEPAEPSIHIGCEYAGICLGSIFGSRNCLNPCKTRNYQGTFGQMEFIEFARQ